MNEQYATRISEAPGRDPVLVVGDVPDVIGFSVGARLRRLREARSVSRRAAAEVIRASEAKISRIETGRVRLKERDAVDLLTLYGVTEPLERERFLASVRQAAQPRWWGRFRDVTPRWFETYLNLERAASAIWTYETQFVPGLFQTAEYAWAVTQRGRLEPHQQAQQVELRMHRQEILQREEGPAVVAVVERSALRRPTVDLPVLAGQLRHLLDLAQRPRVTVQLVPDDFTGQAPTCIPFTILRFADASPLDVVYLEQLDSALYLDRPKDVALYSAAFDALRAQVLTAEETMDALECELRSLVGS